MENLGDLNPRPPDSLPKTLPLDPSIHCKNCVQINSEFSQIITLENYEYKIFYMCIGTNINQLLLLQTCLIRRKIDSTKILKLGPINIGNISQRRGASRPHTKPGAPVLPQGPPSDTYRAFGKRCSKAPEKTKVTRLTTKLLSYLFEENPV